MLEFMDLFPGAFNGRDRTGLAVDPKCPHTVVCTCVNGKVSDFNVEIESRVIGHAGSVLDWDKAGCSSFLIYRCYTSICC